MIPGKRRAARAGAQIERHNLDRVPGPKTAYAGRTQLEAGLARTPQRHVAHRDGILAARRDSLRLARGRRHHRAGAHPWASKWCRRAIWCSSSRRTGTTRRSRSHRSASEKLYRVKDRAFEAVARRLGDGIATTEYDIQQLMWGWFARRGPDQRLGAERVGAGERRQPALFAQRGAHPPDSRRRAPATGSVGQARYSWCGLC